jgi:predicted metal-dependent phosphoesterase TrpH
VARHAHAVGLSAIALTDHDTLTGIDVATAAARPLGLRASSGCEFSVRPWGELHPLAYFVPTGDPALDGSWRSAARTSGGGAQMVESSSA